MAEAASCIADAFQDAIVETDSEGRVTFWNKAAEKIFGYTWEEVAGKPVWELIVPEKYLDENKRGFEEFRKTGNSKVVGKLIRTEAKRKDGTIFPVELSISKRRLKGEWRTIAVIRDITEKAEAEKKIEELNKHLRILNSILRHDLKNTLTTAKLCLELLRGSSPAEVVEKLESLLNKAFDIIEDIKNAELMLSAGELRPVNLGKIVRESASEFGIECDADDVYVMADSAIKSVVYNLIHNALVHNKDVNVRVSLKRVDGLAELRIADDGRGIPDELKQLIFKEGFKGETGRTGLGLYLVRETVKRYGGSVHVEDNKPSGSVFVVRLKCPPDQVRSEL